MKHLLALLSVFALSACGTLFVGQDQTILIDSAPSGVSIYQNGKFLGTTPLTVSVERTKNPLMLKAEKEGYNTQAVMLSSSLGWGGVFDGIFAVLSWTDRPDLRRTHRMKPSGPTIPTNILCT